MTTLIPNTYQKPNWYSDEVDYLLTPEESKVLDFFVRRILGFEDNRASRRDRVSVSQITDGIQRADDTYLSYGTGLNRPQAVAALKGLCDYGLLARIGKPTEEGQEYELVNDLARIDMDGLRARREAKREAGRQRTEIARARRAAAADDSGKTDIPAVSQSNQRLVSLTDSGKTDIPQAVRLTNSQNPQSKPTIKTHTKSCADKSAPPVDEPEPPAVRPSRKREPKLSPDEQAYYAATVPVMAEACCIDLAVEGAWARCQKQLRALYHATVRPTPDLLRREYIQPGGHWYTHDWRGLKGQAPEPQHIAATWGAATTYRDKSNGHARAAPATGYPPQEDGTAALRAKYGAPAHDDPLPPGVIEGRAKRVNAA